MSPENVSAALEIMKARGIPSETAVEVLALVAEKLQDEKTIAKAKRLNVTVEEARGMEAGREAGRAINAKFGYPRGGKR